MNQTGTAVHAFRKNPTKFLSYSLSVGLIALGTIIGATNGRAQTNFYWAGSASANWEDATQWYTTNSAGAFVMGFDWPGDPSNPNDANNQADAAWFTNSGTFNVSLNAGNSGSVFYDGSNMFNNASGTVMNVTINIGSGVDFRPGAGAGFVIGESSSSTTIVSVTTSGTANFDTGFDSTSVYIGKNGYGVLYVTNTMAVTTANCEWYVGNATNSQGLLVVAGTNTLISMGETSGGHLNVGGSSATTYSYGNTVILSNGAVLSVPNFRVGSTGDGGSSNNIMYVDGSLLFIAGGHAVVGSRETHPEGTNPPAINNTLIFKNHGYGDSSNHTFQIGWADNDVDTAPISSTGNVVYLDSGSAFTNISVTTIRPGNSLFVYGGTYGGGYTNIFGGSTTNQGLLTLWGELLGTLAGESGSVTIVSNNVGALTITDGLQMETGSVMQLALGSNFNSVACNSNVTLNGTLNFIDGGGFDAVGNHTYTLFTGNFYTNFVASTNGFVSYFTNTVPYYATTNNMAIGTVPDPSAVYTINLPDFQHVNLIVSGLTQPLPFVITSITRTNAGLGNGNNDVLIQWNTSGSTGTTNHLLVSSGTANASYSTSTFTVLTNIVVTTTTTNYLDAAGATNRPARYYRVSSP